MSPFRASLRLAVQSALKSGPPFVMQRLYGVRPATKQSMLMSPFRVQSEPGSQELCTRSLKINGAVVCAGAYQTDIRFDVAFNECPGCSAMLG